MVNSIKNIIITVLLISGVMAQNAYMNLAHSPGITPSDEITVEPGQTITFEYGGGGAHPMTSDNNSPMYFPTVTVTSSNPIATFSLTDEGTYTFHCGTNPGNSNLWGTIHVDGGVEGPTCTPSDLNEDGVTNILDIVTIVNIILQTVTPTDYQVCASDVNADGITNILDIVVVVNAIMSGNG